MPRPAHDDFGALAREHLSRPRNLGRLAEEGDGLIAAGEAGSRTSGSFLRFYLRIVEGRIATAGYEVLGEPALIAAASYLSERLIGRRAEAADVPPGLELAQALGLPRSEHGAALLAEDAARAALRRPAGTAASIR